MSDADRRAAEWPSVAPPVELAPEEIHVWRMPVTLPRQRIAQLWSLLDVDEERRALALAKGTARDDFVATRAALRLVLAGYLGRAAAALSFRYGRQGKPYLDGETGPELRFSVTHCGGLSLIALARARDLGIDAEGPRTPRHLLAIARRLFHADTVAALEALDEEQRPAAFLAAWTQHEAYAKAIGEGLFRARSPLRLEWPRPDTIRLTEEHALGGTTRIWSVMQVEPETGYIGTLVAEGAISRIRRLDGTGLILA